MSRIITIVGLSIAALAGIFLVWWFLLRKKPTGETPGVATPGEEIEEITQYLITTPGGQSATAPENGGGGGNNYDNSGGNTTAPVNLYTGNSQMTRANTAFLNPDVQWQGNTARIVNQSEPGGLKWYWVGGCPEGNALPENYTLRPGDDIDILMAVAPSPYVWESDWNVKGYAQIKVGQPQ